MCRKNDFIDLHAYVVYVHVNVNVAATLDKRTHQTHHNKEQMAKMKGGESKLFHVLFEKMHDVIFLPIMTVLCNNKCLFSIKDYPWPPPPNDIKGDRDAIRRHPGQDLLRQNKRLHVWTIVSTINFLILLTFVGPFKTGHHIIYITVTSHYFITGITGSSLSEFTGRRNHYLRKKRQNINNCAELG